MDGYSFCTTFVLKLVFNVLVRCLHEDLREDLRSWTNENSTMTRKLVRSTLIISHPQSSVAVASSPFHCSWRRHRCGNNILRSLDTYESSLEYKGQRWMMCAFLNWAQPHCLATSTTTKSAKRLNRFYKSDCGWLVNRAPNIVRLSAINCSPFASIVIQVKHQ